MFFSEPTWLIIVLFARSISKPTWLVFPRKKEEIASLPNQLGSQLYVHPQRCNLFSKNY
jgi:hypothetical protein